MPFIKIHLLNTFELVYNEDVLTTTFSQRIQTLLAFLILHRKAPQKRLSIALQLWPSGISEEDDEPIRNDKQTRNNLRTVLNRLRKAFPQIGDYVIDDGESLQWKVDSDFLLDIDQFERAIFDARRSKQQGTSAELRQLLERAISLYTGDLWPTCYDDWIVPERERLHRLFINTLEELIGLLVTEGNERSAEEYTERLLGCNDLDDDHYKRLIQFYTKSGSRTGVLRIYQAYEKYLGEVGIEPDRTAREAYFRIIDETSAAVLQQPTPSVTRITQWQLIGRQTEWNQLRQAWSIADNGHPHLVCISGESGIGKTRLAEELLDWAHQQGIMHARTRCYESEGRLPFEPIIEWLRSETLLPQIKQLEAVWQSEVARVLPELLATPSIEKSPTRLFEGLARAILPSKGALLLLIDDLQWCEQDTLDWLHYLLRFKPNARLLVVATVRTEELNGAHPATKLLLNLRGSGLSNEIVLGPLNTEESAKLATLVSAKIFDEQESQRLYQETEGYPIFIVEMMRSQLSATRETRYFDEQQTGMVSPGFATTLSPKLRAVIQRRLSQLSQYACELAEVAATIGRSFSTQLLAKACNQDEKDFVSSLDELWMRQIVREQKSNQYDFSHDRIREVIYASIPPARRRRFHQRIAEALINLNQHNLDEVSPLLAVHYEQAGLVEKAVSYFHQAVVVAMRIGATTEAAKLAQKGIDTINDIATPLELLQWKFQLSIQLAITLAISKGHAASETFEAFQQARDLYEIVFPHEKSRDYYVLFPIVLGLQTSYMVQGKLSLALQSGLELKKLAQLVENLSFIFMADFAIGQTSMFMGDFSTARECASRTISHYELHDYEVSMDAIWISYDAGAIHLADGALIYAIMGDLPKSLLLIRHATNLIRRTNHPYGMTYVAFMDVVIQQFCRNIEVCQAATKEAIRQSQKAENPQYVLHSKIVLGWIYAQQNKFEEGIPLMKDAILGEESAGSNVAQTYYLSMLAESFCQSGQVEEGLSTIARAQTVAIEQNEHWMDAEHLRLKGELMRLRGDLASDIEMCFQEAIRIAQTQGAKLLELRAVLSLARLYQAQGQVHEARQRLTEILVEFAFIIDPKISGDLTQAIALLHELSDS